MLKQLTAAVLKDIFSLLRENQDYFDKNPESRKDLLCKEWGPDYSPAIISYISNVSLKSFMADSQEALEFFKSDYGNASDNGLLQAIALYLSSECSLVLDEFDDEFFWKNIKDRHQALKEFFNEKTELSGAVVDCFLNSTYQDLSLEIFEAIAKVKNIGVNLVQTPVEMKSKGRKNIRAHFLQKNPWSFVEFQVSKSLIGGLRVFENGKVIDNSWLSRVQKLSQIKL